MKRNWLIRTYSNQILGPVTRKKILDLLDRKMLTENDELSSGNGYWFFVHEKDLLKNYVIDGIEQTFNPISEAPTLLAVTAANPDITSFVSREVFVENNDSSKQDESFDGKIPEGTDLEFPEVVQNTNRDERSLIERRMEMAPGRPINKNDENIVSNPLKEENVSLPKNEDLEYPTGIDEINEKDLTTPFEISSETLVDLNNTEPTSSKKINRKMIYVKVPKFYETKKFIFALVFLILAIAFFLYSILGGHFSYFLGKPLSFIEYLIPTTYAENSLLVKKKVSIHLNLKI